MESLPPSDQKNGIAALRRGNVKDRERRERVTNETCSSEPKVHCTWSNIHLFLICTALSFVLMLILEGCRPPSEPWKLFGPDRVSLWDWRALQIVLAFTVLQGVLYYLPFGTVAEGKVGQDGRRIRYNMNGLHALAVTAILLAGLWYCGMFQGTTISGRVLQIVMACVALSLLTATVLYLHSLRIDPRQLVKYGDGGNFLQEFSLGRIADPSVGRIDLKHFYMVRIGFIGWALADLSYLLTEVEMRGTPSLALLLVVTFQFIYILEFLINEETVLFTKEYTEDGIGFVMILGEYIWIPFSSSVPAWFLLQRPTHVGPLPATVICLIFGFGFLVYYLSNYQKHKFRKNPNDPAFAHMETIPSPSGQNLLVSGWFGWVRHPNYLGDIMMTLAWCLPCGTSSLLPYLLLLHTSNLLRRRAGEIEETCMEKHGQAWVEYCHRVPHQLVPHVY